MTGMLYWDEVYAFLAATLLHEEPRQSMLVHQAKRGKLVTSIQLKLKVVFGACNYVIFFKIF